ncbi:MAG: hypothetical protein OK449_03120 [Thaumarchaeota archaeon]|nr:hypothetical protein [Nitrososphaerota archaeon]
MKSEQGIAGMAPTILYFVAGVFWVGVIVVGGGFLLFWAALACFLSGIFLFNWASSWVTRPLTRATALFGLALTLYQLYVALTLIGTGLDSVALISAGLFGLLTVVYLYLLFFGGRKKQA